MLVKTWSAIGRRKHCPKGTRLVSYSVKLLIRSPKWRANYGGVPASSKIDDVPFLFVCDHRCKLMAATTIRWTSEPMANEASSVLGKCTYACPALVLRVNGLIIVYAWLHSMADMQIRSGVIRVVDVRVEASWRICGVVVEVRRSYGVAGP